MIGGIKKGIRITGNDRQVLAEQITNKYNSGMSIRSLADETGRSYGFIHRLLNDSGVPMRSRGGATRKKAKPAE